MKWDDICKRDQAWNAAKADLLDGRCKIVDERLLNCLKYAGLSDMKPGCLEKLLAAYGQ